MFKHRYMTTRIFLLFVASFALFQANGQKVYSTNAATVRFIAVDDKDIDATNKSRESPRTQWQIEFHHAYEGF